LELEILQKREEEGEKSNRVSPRRHQLKKFEEQGIKIKDCKLPQTKHSLENLPAQDASSSSLIYDAGILKFLHLGYYKVKKDKGDAKVLKLLCPFV
jgi:hypothetical protein